MTWRMTISPLHHEAVTVAVDGVIIANALSLVADLDANKKGCVRTPLARESSSRVPRALLLFGEASGRVGRPHQRMHAAARALRGHHGTRAR